MLDQHIENMKFAYELVEAVTGSTAKVSYPRVTSYYNNLAQDGRLLIKEVTQPEQLSEKLASRVSSSQWKIWAEQASTRGIKITLKGLKVIAVIGAAASAVNGFADARADGAPLPAALGVGAIETVNPLPWSTIEIHDKLIETAEDARRAADAYNQAEINNSNAHGAGLPNGYINDPVGYEARHK